MNGNKYKTLQKFIIGTDNFGAGEIIYKIDKENLIINELTIIGNEQAFEKLSYIEGGNWFSALYPPILYLKAIPFELKDDKIQVIITEETLDDCDVALYLWEHNDIEGIITIDKDEVFLLKGYTYILGKKIKLEIEVKLNTHK